MKKLFALLMAVVMIAAVFSVSAVAAASPGDMVRTLMTSENVSFSSVNWKERVKVEDLNTCLESVDPEMIPEECNVRSGRISVMSQQNISCADEDVYDATFKVWSTYNRTICLFFRAEGEEKWELLSCNLGDVIEARFPCNGSCVIAVAW